MKKNKKDLLVNHNKSDTFPFMSLPHYTAFYGNFIYWATDIRHFTYVHTHTQAYTYIHYALRFYVFFVWPLQHTALFTLGWVSGKAKAESGRRRKRGAANVIAKLQQLCKMRRDDRIPLFAAPNRPPPFLQLFIQPTAPPAVSWLVERPTVPPVGFSRLPPRNSYC